MNGEPPPAISVPRADGPLVPAPIWWGRILLVALGMVALWLAATSLAGEYHRRQQARALAAMETGQALVESGRAEPAAAAFRTAVALEPGQASYRLALARALVALERYDEAERYLQDVLLVDATSGDANLARARIQRARGRFGDAEASYYRAIHGRWSSEDEPSRVRARLELIDLLGGTADGERVRAELTQLATAFPGDQPLLLRVGRQLLDSGFPEEAARVFRTVSDRFTDPGAAPAGLAEALLAAGDYEGAAAAARRALLADPDDQASATRLALATTVDGLDPNKPRLPASERAARVRRLLELARPRIEACWTGRSLGAEQLGLRARLDAPRPASVTPRVLDEEAALLEAVARAVSTSCPSGSGETALDLALRRVAGGARR
ncbi:MAG: tetratricopeptide repeat protein [Vicinamibacterales bacterium]